MLSVVGEEYIAYSESVKGQYTPMVAIQRYDGTLTYREIVKEDLVRIKDEQTVPGGWIFRKSQNTASSWVRRFALIRGSFMFFFHSPQNEKPIAVVPLEDCTVVAPDMGHKTFDEMRSYKANEGFEFDIRHNSRSTVRLYTVSEQERLDWVSTCRERVEAANMKRALEGKPTLVGTGNMVITSTKLTGLSLLPTAPTNTNTFSTHTAGSNYSNLPPLPQEAYPYTNTNTNTYSTAATYHQTGTSSVNMSPPPNRQSIGTSSGNYGGRQSNTSNAPYGAPYNAPYNAPYGSPQAGAGAGMSSTASVATSSRPAVYQQKGTAPYQNPQKTAQQAGLNKFRSRKDLGFEFMLLEENLKKKLADQLEARTREAAAKVKLYSKETITAAQEAEAKAPLNLAELFRLSLCFVDEEVAEDPQEGTQLQMPHLKGQAIEEMLITVYRRYCGESGFMSLEQFIEFFEDSAILHTHAPHNENDEPVEEFVTLLDPVRLLTLVPRNIGFSVAEAYDTVNDKLAQASKNDKFIINFSQFYMLLLRVTQIVYADLFEKDSTLAFNKLLQEVMCPLFVWCKGHHKRGSRDVLVLEERILLLMTTYAPNLYRVFLTYGHDAVGKVPEINRVFPETAQANERGMFKAPPVAPAHQLDIQATADSIFMTESGCLRFARDYGILPYVLSVKQIREIYRTVNRTKLIVSSRLPTRDMLQNKMHSTAQITSAQRAKQPAPMKISSKISKTGFGSSSAKDIKLGAQQAAANNAGGVGAGPGSPQKKGPTASRIPTGPAPASPQRTRLQVESSATVDEDGQAPPPPPSPSSTIGGIGFSEFVEFISRVAVEGMQQENYDVVFPTPFSKVLAMLTVWGVADLKKLEEVRIIHTEEIYQ